jgi:hypothetical protein
MFARRHHPVKRQSRPYKTPFGWDLFGSNFVFVPIAIFVAPVFVPIAVFVIPVFVPIAVFVIPVLVPKPKPVDKWRVHEGLLRRMDVVQLPKWRSQQAQPELQAFRQPKETGV